MPEPVAGSVRARGTIIGDPRSPGFTIDAQGAQLQWGPGLRAKSMTLVGSLAPGITARGRVGLDTRPLKLAVTAVDLVTPPVDIKSLRFAPDGTLARHTAKLDAAGDGAIAGPGLGRTRIRSRRRRSPRRSAGCRLARGA